jgi:ribosome-binding protein aMBF1 (putative translation factor)
MEMDEQLRASLAASTESYRDIAEKIGIDHTSLVRFANGTRTLRLDVATKLAAYLGLKLQPENSTTAEGSSPAKKPANPSKRTPRKKKPT